MQNLSVCLTSRLMGRLDCRLAERLLIVAELGGGRKMEVRARSISNLVTLSTLCVGVEDDSEA